jgi:hypothetical protein
VIESEADRLGYLQAVGEQFDTGKPTRMWAIFDRPTEDVLVAEITFAARRPVILCRTSDVIAHELVKQSKITRVSEAASFFVKEIEDDGTGMTFIALS